jgi:branched-chain amino acid transport system ATP-binding protein
MIAGTFGNKALSKDRINGLLEEQFQLFPRLKERRNQAGGTLSGGEQQMLAISRGLMMDPDIMMLDEPSLGLAPIVVEEIFELILKIRGNGKTILLIEQNASMALSIADRGYVLENGLVTLAGSGQELLRNENVKKAYLGA